MEISCFSHAVMLWTDIVLKNIYCPKALNTSLLKHTGKWLIMPYAGFCVFVW